MGKTGGKNGKKGGGLTQDDARLWKSVVRDVVPLDGALKKNLIEEAFLPATSELPLTKTTLNINPSVPPAPKKESTQPPQLDLRTDLRLRRGQMEIEDRLDLHGLNQEQAHTRLNAFVTSAHRRGLRCVLVITGKGKSGQGGQGILREKLPLWLSMHPVSGLVLKIQMATVRDGGSGAYYLYLKRTRTTKE